jgi:histidine triad (HIT) family protein
MSDCLFCKIIQGKIPVEIVAENEHALAFRDINPQASTHVLVIPREHIASTRELIEQNISALSHMALLANEISISEGVLDDGYRWVINTGSNGGQTVFHIHLHLIGGRKMNWPPG